MCLELRQTLQGQLEQIAKFETQTQDFSPEAKIHYEILFSLWKEHINMGMFVTGLAEEMAALTEHVQELTSAHNSLCELSNRAQVKYLSPLDFMVN